MHLDGPLMIDSDSTTVVLPDGVAADIDPFGSLVITRIGGVT
jgi:hypothetical protein